jgi:hypothetical protein
MAKEEKCSPSRKRGNGASDHPEKRVRERASLLHL